MRKAKPILLFVPSSIMSVIDEKVKKSREKYVYIIHYLLLKPTNDRRISDYVPLNRKKLSTLFDCNIAPYIKFLEKYELIERDSTYIPNEKSFHYRINPKHPFDCNTFELKPETTLFKNIIREVRRERANFNLLEPYLSAMRGELMRLQYDFNSALKWVQNNVEGDNKTSYMISIHQLHDKRFRYFKRNRTNNRLDTNLTNLPSNLRQYIKGDFVQIDLKNSQPFFLGILFEKITELLKYFNLKNIPINTNNIETLIHNKHLPYCIRLGFVNLVKSFGIQTIKEISKIHNKHDFAIFMNYSTFKKWTREGNFYDEFTKQFDSISREDCKEMMFQILFSRNVVYYGHKAYKPFEREKEIFCSVFPALYEVIESLKGKNHARLAIYLQRFESRIFIDNVAKELFENGITPLTIHDSVVIPSHQQEKALSIIKAVFQREVGIVPTFKIESLSKCCDTESGGQSTINEMKTTINELITSEVCE